ncbi:MAG TPA: histidine kinase [Lapillicoccus sp.]|nr:histidine kinase [Lapillicoccus sp.]
MVEATPTGRSWMLWAMAVTAIAILTGVLILSLANARLEPTALRVFLVAWIVVPYVVSGVVAWWRRPASRLGPLMLLTGIAMALVPMQWSAQPWVHSVGHVLDMLPAAMFLHVFLAFPTGRVRDRAERVLVVATYSVTVGLQVVKIALGVNPDSVFTLVAAPAAANVVEGIQLALVSCALLLGVVLLHRRRSGRERFRRRPATLVVDAFSFALVMLALLYGGALFGWTFLEPIRLIAFAALGLAPVAFLFALLDRRLARGDVAGLLVELQADPTIDLQAPLARAVRDPSLRLAFWLPELATWSDQDGNRTAAPDPEHRGVRILYRDGEPMAALTFDPGLDEEHELLDAVVATTSIALENGRLRAELRARLNELQESRVRASEAGRKERQRLERDLHDGAQARLVALSMELGMLGTDVATDDAMKGRLLQAKREVSASLEELRSVARGIYPAVLTAHGLAVALESVTARCVVPTELTVDVPERPAAAVEVAAYYVVNEAVANIGKHSGATAAWVCVERRDGRLVVDVRDNGRGDASASPGSGLDLLALRVQALGGRLAVSPAKSGGTQVRAEFPCP